MICQHKVFQPSVLMLWFSAISQDFLWTKLPSFFPTLSDYLTHKLQLLLEVVQQEIKTYWEDHQNSQRMKKIYLHKFWHLPSYQKQAMLLFFLVSANEDDSEPKPCCKCSYACQSGSVPPFSFFQKSRVVLWNELALPAECLWNQDPFSAA